MEQDVSPAAGSDSALSGAVIDGASAERDGMADLKVFWGPEICRLEYLLHLVDTGRIKDSYWSAASR